MCYTKLSGAHFPFPSSVTPSEKATEVGWHRRWHGLGWCPQPTHPQNQDQCREIGFKHFLQQLKQPNARAGASGAQVLVEVATGPLLLIREEKFLFPSPLMSLKFVLQKTQPAWLCAWEMDFIPQETYLSFCSEVGTK